MKTNSRQPKRPVEAKTSRTAKRKGDSRAARGSAATFASYYLKDGKWYLCAWGIKTEDVTDELAALWKEQRFGGVDGVKVEPTPEILKDIKGAKPPNGPI